MVKYDLTAKDLSKEQVVDLLERIDGVVSTVQSKIEDTKVLCERCGKDIYQTSRKNPEKTLEWSEKQFPGHKYCYKCQQELKVEKQED